MRARGPLLALVVLASAPIAAQRAGPDAAPEPASDGPAGLSAATWEAAVTAADRALDWLEREQRPAGYWSADVGHKQMDGYIVLRSGAGNDARGEGHIGVTALAGMAFLAGGHVPDRGPRGATVRRTVDYVLSKVGDTGLIRDGGTRMYSHAFATLFLAEVYGTQPGDEIRAGLESAVRLVVDCQNAQGGWRYNPFTTEADMSVTVCQLQALRAARNIGIEVPKRTVDDAVAYVLRARTERGPYTGLFFYKTAGAGAWSKNRDYAINAAALTALLSAGVHDEQYHAPVLDWLDREYGAIRDYYPEHYYFWYGNYYACQAFFHAGGARFATYQRRVVDDLLTSQARDGRWRNTTGPGDAFSTAVGALILQIPKQYLPIFQR